MSKIELKEGSRYYNKSGKHRQICRIEKSIDGRDRVFYIKDSIFDGMKSCYTEQFKRWLRR